MNASGLHGIMDKELVFDHTSFPAYIEAEYCDIDKKFTTVKVVLEIADNIWAELDRDHFHLVDQQINNHDWWGDDDYEPYD